MATNVDERIVAAKFDSSDFEKGVNKTVKKLDELKKSLDLKEATKGVKELAEKTEASTDSMSKSLEKLTERFTSFTGMIKQKILSGLADEVAGVFLKLEQSVKGFIKGISSDQVSAGMSKYEQMLTSVRVMMSAGDSQDSAYEAIGKLQAYSDQTSYSLTQMTDALSKLRAAGVDLDTATKSVEGIANACANAGINAMDAQRAFYNLSQAYGKGTLNYTDYKSLELLNMTTEKFKEQLLDAAVAAGTLKKTNEGVYKTVKKTGEKVVAGKKVTKENLQDMLRYNFVTKDVMNQLFGDTFFFDEEKWDEAKEIYGDDLEAIKEAYGKVAVESYMAAREARSFTDVLNTLKDVVSTGWSTTFELMFGRLEEAKVFFTDLVENGLADVIYKIGEYRNAVLGYWNGINLVGEGSGGKVFRDSILAINDALGTLFKTFLQVLPGFDELEDGKKQDTLKGIGVRLYKLTRNFREFTFKVKEAADRFNEFMNSPIAVGAPTRIELIRSALANISSVFGIMAKAVGIAFYAIEKAYYTLHPIFDGIFIFLDKITAPLTSLKNDTEVFDDLTHTINNLSTVLSPVADILGKIIGFLGDVGAFFAEMAISTVTMNIQFFSDALGLLLELITGKSSQLEKHEGVLDKIRADFEGIKTACADGLNTVKEFFSALIGDIKRLLGLTDKAEEGAEDKEGGIFSGLINFFNTNQFIQDAKAWVEKAIVDVGDFIKSIPERIYNLGANIYDTIWHLFFYEKREDVGGEMQTNVYKTELGEWLAKVIEDIKDFVIHIPDKIISAIGTVGNWINDVFNAIFGVGSTDNAKENTKEDSKTTNNENDPSVAVKERFNAFIAETAESIKQWFANLPQTIEKALKGIGNFFKKLFNALDEFLFGKKETKAVMMRDETGKKLGKQVVTKRIKTGFSKFLDEAIKAVKQFIKDIPKHVKNAIKGAGDIISTLVSAIFGKEDGEEVKSEEIKDKLEKPFLGIDLAGILNTIKEIGLEIFNQVMRIFTGSDKLEENQEAFASAIASGIEWIRTKADIALKWVLEFFSNLPTNIAKLFEGEDANNQDKGPIGKAIGAFGETIKTFVLGIPTAISQFIDSAITEIGNLWNKLYKGVFGDNNNWLARSFNKVNDTVNKVFHPDAVIEEPTKAIETPWQQFIKSIGETISHAFTELPTWIAQGIHMAIAGINSLFGSLTEWLSGDAAADEMQKAAEEAKKQVQEGTETVSEGLSEGVEDTAKKAEDESGDNQFLTAIKGIGQTLYNFITTTVPSFISAAWTWLGTQAANIWNGIRDIFSGEPNGDEKDAAGDNIKTAIQTFLQDTLPEKIKTLWNDLKNLGIDIWNGVAAAFFPDKIPDNERQDAIKNIVEGIKNTLISAFNAIKELFSGKSYKDNIVGNDEMYKQVVAAVDDQQRQANKRLKQEGKDGSIWTFAGDVGNSILSAFESVGPLILNGLTKAFEWLSNIATYIIQELTGEKTLGDQIEEAYGEEKPEITNALSRIGESLKNFFLVTLPKFLGTVLAHGISGISTFFSNFYEGLNSVAEEEAETSADELGSVLTQAYSEGISEEDAKKLQESTNPFLSSLQNFIKEIGNLASNDTVKTLAVLALIAVIMHTLADIFGVARVAENVGYALKWAAILVAVGALATIMSAITDLVKTGTPQQIKNAKTIMDELGELVDKIGNLALVIAGIKALSVIGDIFSGDETKTINMSFGGFKEKFLGGLGEFLGSIPSTLTSIIGSFGKGLAVAGGITVAGKAVNATIDETVSTVTSSLTEMTAGTSSVMEFITPFINTMLDLNGKLDIAISSASKFGTLYAELFQSFSGLYSDVSGNELIGNSGNVGADVKFSTELYTIDLNKRLEAFIMLSSFINQLTSSLKTFEDIEDPDKAINDFLEFSYSVDEDGVDKITQFISSMMTSLNKAYEEIGYYPDHFVFSQTFATGMGVVSDALTAFIEGLRGFDETNVSVLERALSSLNLLASAFNESDATQESLSKVIFGNRTLSKFGLELKMFGGHIAGFYTNVKSIEGFKENEVEETNRKVDSIVKLAQGMASATRMLDTVGVDPLDTFGSKLSSLGHNIGTFFRSFNGVLKANNVDAKRVHLLTDAANAIANIMYALNKAFGEGNRFDSVIDQFYNQMADENRYEKLGKSLTMISDAIITSLTNEEQLDKLGNAGAVIARELFTKIQETLDNPEEDLQPKITPVLNLDTAKQQLVDFFGVGTVDAFNLSEIANSAIGANSTVDEDRVKWADLSLKLDGINTAIGELKSSTATVSDVADAFAGLTIVTDTEVLGRAVADTVDEEIGRKIWLITRGMATR